MEDSSFDDPLEDAEADAAREVERIDKVLKDAFKYPLEDAEVDATEDVGVNEILDDPLEADAVVNALGNGEELPLAPLPPSLVAAALLASEVFPAVLPCALPAGPT